MRRNYDGMNKDAKIAWVNALRSGKYPRHSGKNEDLHLVDGYNLLGVLCEVYCQATGKKWQFKHGAYCIHGAFFDYDLPPRVKEWAGLDGVEGWTLLCGADDCGVDFETLADIIEYWVD